MLDKLLQYVKELAAWDMFCITHTQPNVMLMAFRHMNWTAPTYSVTAICLHYEIKKREVKEGIEPSCQPSTELLLSIETSN
jgi:hypothetical protein